MKMSMILQKLVAFNPPKWQAVCGNVNHLAAAGAKTITNNDCGNVSHLEYVVHP